MLLPKRVKYRRHHKGRLKGYSNANNLAFGDVGLQAITPGWVTARQIEAARRTLTRVIRRTGKLWIRIFPDKPITARATESRMGSGKGSVEYWVAVVKPGALIFEVAGLNKKVAYNILKLASRKFPIRTFIIKT